jgi:hypothetical protein
MLEFAWQEMDKYYCLGEGDTTQKTFNKVIQNAIQMLKEGKPHDSEMDEYGDSWQHQAILTIFDKFGGGKEVSSEESTHCCVMTPLTQEFIKTKISELQEVLDFINGVNHANNKSRNEK